MKNVYFTFFLLSIGLAYSQVQKFGGEFKTEKQTSCISDLQRTAIHANIQKQRIKLTEQGILKDQKLNKHQAPLAHPLFIWPMVKNPAAPYSEISAVGNYVDHNSSYPGQLLDWACGNRTYDTSGGYNHMGIDVSPWPFAWYQFQNNQAWAVAAADGVILGKDDGNFDMSCGFNSNPWNAVYIQHADGSTSWYGHLKKNSLTAKAVGQSVTAGEFLGVIGSAGNSTGVHLHFEVYNSSGQLVDPYSGPCNTWGSSTDSWWANQKPYNNPTINAVLTHSSPPVFNSCPQTEIANLMDSFTEGSPVVAAIYLTDQLQNTTGKLEIVNPVGTIVYSENINFANSFQLSHWYWTFGSALFTQNGVWTVVFTYAGKTVNHKFNYGSLGSEDFKQSRFSVYPKPTQDMLYINSDDNSAIDEISIFDMVGKEVLNQSGNQSQIDISSLENGVYLLHLKTDGQIYSDRIIKN